MRILLSIFAFCALIATAKAQYPLTINILPGADPDTCNYLSFYPSGNASLTGKGVALSYATLGENLYDNMNGVDTVYEENDTVYHVFYGGGIFKHKCKDFDWIKTGTVAGIPLNTDSMYHVDMVTIGNNTAYTGMLNVVGRIDQRFGEIGDYNIMIGRYAGRDAMTGAANIGIGNSVLDASTTGANNVGIGNGSLGGLTTGNRNFAMGSSVLSSNVTGSDNVAVGNSALNSYTGSKTIGFGVSALQDNITGLENIGIGYQSGITLGSGDYNTFIGNYSGYTTDGNDNVFIGHKSGELNEGSSNIFIGKESGQNETGSSLLYIEPSNGTPLIKGDFAADSIRINGSLSVRDIAAGSSTDNTLGWNSSTKKVTIKSAPYLVYTALLTQSGTSAPTATVLTNTLGGTVIFTYNGVGDYTATLSGVFTANRTTIETEANNVSTAKDFEAIWDSTSTIDLYTTDSWDSANSVLNNSFFEIRVYP